MKREGENEPTPSKRQTKLISIGMLLQLLFLLLLLFAIYHVYSQQDFLSSELQNNQRMMIEQKLQLQHQQELYHKLEQENQGQQRQLYQSLEPINQQLSSLQQQINPVDISWVLPEVEYLLRMVEVQSALQNQPQLAASTLQRAILRLQSLQRAELNPLLEQLFKQQIELYSTPAPRLSNRLQQLRNLAEKLPHFTFKTAQLLHPKMVPSETPSTSVEAGTEKRWANRLARFGNALQQEISQLFIIRSPDLISEEKERPGSREHPILIQQMLVRIEMIRLTLIAGVKESYHQEVRSLKQLLKKSLVNDLYKEIERDIDDLLDNRDLLRFQSEEWIEKLHHLLKRSPSSADLPVEEG